MKVKKYIGKSINGFIILNSYVKITPNNKKTRKVLLECENCGRILERASGADFEHIKCKCMCAPEFKHHKKVTYKGVEYSKKDLAEKFNIKPSTFKSRLQSGYSVEEAVKGGRDVQCVECYSWFISKNNGQFCSARCRNRHLKSKKPMMQLETAGCVVCNKLFVKSRKNSVTCSYECRHKLACIERDKRYKYLKSIGKFDRSVILANVYERFDGICQHCGKFLSFENDVLDDNYPSIDHIIPLSKGGTHTWDNVQLLCRRCNYIKSDDISEVIL